MLSALLELRVLGLSKKFLTGTIPASLGNLSSLEYLFIANNDLHGLLLEELGRLTQLRSLVIEQTNVTGEIPSSLFNNSVLTVLSFTLNKLSGRLPSDMFSRLPNLQVLGNLPNIPSLKLAGNQLTSDGPSGMAFFTSLANSPKLQVLALSVNRLRGKLLPSIGNRQPLKRTVTGE
ncbi:Leucine-rich repeat receptor-like protein kinase pxl1 [Thalictrum thalictroides]|uniref:Leucine-rich repeat receptor-like protein kinase pxl1 n=1 Tax=Thalictrum thalictroides TaxID=46969 RepID=A0A7J6XC03_THATH|nr:Leucine-rich repeat receptor-like protein kinase pxl1 [Thalictrum thalictroides]